MLIINHLVNINQIDSRFSRQYNLNGNFDFCAESQYYSPLVFDSKREVKDRTGCFNQDSAYITHTHTLSCAHAQP